MEHDSSHWLEILQYNRGFEYPSRWVDYARQHNFAKVKARKLSACPDCGNRSWDKMGQYVYYSTLINLNECEKCHLIFSDTRIDPGIIYRHFESGYKDEPYFTNKRELIFDHIAGLIHRYASLGASVLDVGGAKGHLMAKVQKARHDLNITINDISKESCDWANSQYGFRSICRPASQLHKLRDKFDIVSMIDVVYYEPDLPGLWGSLNDILKENGTLIIRVPNKLLLIRSLQFIKSLTKARAAREMFTHIRYFNPEHLFIMPRKYLVGRLKALGFRDIKVIPSPLLASDPRLLLISKMYYGLARVIHFISLFRAIVTPALVVVASRDSLSRS